MGAADEGGRVGEGAAEILVGAEGEEAAVEAAAGCARGGVVGAVGGAVALDVVEDGVGGDLCAEVFGEGGVAAGEAGEVDEVEVCAVGEGAEVGGGWAFVLS